MIIFDYIYYRITKAYFKWDGRTGFTGILLVSMMQVMTISAVIMFFIAKLYTVAETTPHKRTMVNVFLAFSILLTVLNYRHYNGRYNSLKRRWKEEADLQKFQRGILVVLGVALPWIIVVVIVANRTSK